MTLRGTYAIPAPRDTVWQRLMDPQTLARALPGCEKIEPQPDGSFGETCASYDDPSLKGKGDSTASQTAWGAMGLMAAGGADDPAVRRAVRWLVENQAADGAWDELTGRAAGVPRLTLRRWTENLRERLATAAVSVSRCGYNTALDLPTLDGGLSR